MRSKATNVLQGIVLFVGIVYVIIGLFFYISPISVLEFFAENFPEDWLKQVINDEIVGPLYIISRGFSALLFSSGIAMIMPLFDPLRYRGLIYYNGLAFPFLSSILFLYNGISLVLNSKNIEAGNGFFQAFSSPHGHLLVLILGIVFALIFILTAFGLILTNKMAKEGME